MLQQGLVLAALMDPSDNASGPLSRVEGPGSEQCRALYAHLRNRGASDRRRAAIDLSKRLFSPVPANLDQVHPSWLRHLLEQQTPAVARLVADTLPSAIPARLGPEARARPTLTRVPGWVRPELCRTVFARIEPMPGGSRRQDSAADPQRLARLSTQRLMLVLSDLGLLVLAQAVTRTEDPTLPEAVATSLPPALRQRFQRARGVKRLSRLPQSFVCSTRRPHEPSGATAFAFPGPQDGDVSMQERLRRLALRVVAPLLSRCEQRQLAQRLPRELGVMLWEQGPVDPVENGLADAVSQLLREAESWMQEQEQ